MSKVQVDTIDTRSGTATMTVGSTNTTTVSIPKAVTLGASGTTVTIPSGATITNSGTATGFGGDNTPSFRTRLASNQTISNTTSTKLSFATEDWDTDSAFASNKFTVPSGEGGKYVFNIHIGTDPIGDQSYIQLLFYINGSNTDYGKTRTVMAANSKDTWMNATLITSLSASDYVEAYIHQSSGGSVTIYNTGSFFSAYKLIGV